MKRDTFSFQPGDFPEQLSIAEGTYDCSERLSHNPNTFTSLSFGPTDYWKGLRISRDDILQDLTQFEEL
ncbi:hypothetical protein BDW22DRAFT_1352993 [Trametopsis cervina]|nr:hypothetical protein BDW22DRAFT_1352993 [Trametopsis cervina]